MDKLSRLKVKIGYPNEWRDYSRLELRPNELVDNVHNAKIFDWLRGHELIHGFDDDGRKYNGAGALSNWWTDADAREFNARAAELSQQYSSFEPLPGLHMNGGLTIGENIADLGGVLVALDAYHRWLAGRSAPVLGGFTGDQRFFLSFAQSFRAKRTDEATRQLVVSDSHPPDQYRVNGIVKNIDAWYVSGG